METKERSEIPDYWWSAPGSPDEVLQRSSKEAVKEAGESWHSPFSGGSMNTPDLQPAVRHRRSTSELVTTSFQRLQHSGSNINFQKLKSQMQRALHWGSHNYSQDKISSFDPEILANQKRQWCQLQSKTADPDKFKEPSSLFEHFVIVGLRPDADLKVVKEAFSKRKNWEQEMATAETYGFNTRHFKRPPIPTMEPQVLFKYPPGKKLDLRLKDLAAFCFPGGVKVDALNLTKRNISETILTGKLERTPSLSELNALLYGQEHLCRDDFSFVFSLKVADSATLYGVCLHVQEIVREQPVHVGVSSPFSQSHSGCSRFLVSAPRCYCILTRVPFFELHYEMLNSIIAQKRLNRITQFVDEMALADYAPSSSVSNNHINGNVDSPDYASDDEVPSSRWEPGSPGSATASVSSDHNQMRELDKDGDRSSHAFDECTFENSERRSNSSEHILRIHYNDHTSDVCPCICPRVPSSKGVRSSETSISSARSMALEEEDDKVFYNHDKDASDEITVEFARDNNNDMLQIICGYHSKPLPTRGSKIIFQPLEHLQPIEYQRPPVSALEVCSKYLDLELKDSGEISQVNLKLAAAEEARALSLWSTTTICRVLSLESVLALVTSMLLEKQVVVLCPNLGVLSAVVLSLIPIIRPFEWQSLFLPILPEQMLDFIDAPVPFVVGIQHKFAGLKMKASNLVRVNIAKDQVKACNLPLLPKLKELISELRPIHAALSSEDSVSQRQPAYKCNEVQAEAAGKFLVVMRRYLESLCSELRSHTITSIVSNNDRVSILLKDTFIDSFPVRDQPFVKLLVETQLFTVLSDSRLSSFENEHS